MPSPSERAQSFEGVAHDCEYPVDKVSVSPFQQEPGKTNTENRDSYRFRILVVDDQPDSLGALSAVLELAGYNSVRCLSDSRQVMSVYDEFKPDLIMLDLNMPHVDGLAVLDQLGKVIPEDDYLPVLVLTGDGRSETREQALSRGAKDFLSKPLNRIEVQLRVKNLLQTRHLHLQLRTQNIFLEEQVREGTDLAEKLAYSNQALKEINHKMRETQAQLIQTEKMASLGQLVAGIAHEINNPLAFVMNNLFTIEHGMNQVAPQAEPHLSETAKAKLQKVLVRLKEMKEGLDRVKDLVLNLRTFSRLDEGEFKTIDLRESIDSVLQLLHHRMIGRIQVETEYRAERSLHCYGGRLNQVFMNLISNAMDSIDGKGKIVIRTSDADGVVVISVQDTGAGIPEAIRSRIFDPFFTTKPVGKGTGLGLAISYGIVQDHHGSIEFVTEERIGSEFIVKIPRNLEARIGN